MSPKKSETKTTTLNRATLPTRPFRCLGISEQMFNEGGDEAMAKLKKRPNVTIGENRLGDEAVFAEDHKVIRMLTVAEVTLAEKNLTNNARGVKRCEACQDLFSKTKTKSTGKSPKAKFKQLVSIINDATEALELRDQLAPEDVTHLEQVLEQAESEKDELLEANPDYADLIEA